MERQCIKCSKLFNNITPCNTWVDIRGRRCCWECRLYNTGNRKALISHVSKVCRLCKIELPTEMFYFRSSTERRTKTNTCRNCIIRYNRQRELSIKIKLINYKGGCCSVCGYKRNVYALDFHHRDPSIKEFNLAHTSGITEAVLAEIDKCDLLCSNCHREYHHPDKNGLL